MFNLSPQSRVYAAFFLYALVLGGIFTRLGEIQHAMGIGEGALGAALMGTAVGAQISLMFAGVVLKKIGHRAGLLIFIPALGIAQTLATLSPSPQVLFILLLLSGLNLGTLEVIVNLEADRVEHKIGRRIMSRSHAFWSFRFFGAGLLGAFARHMDFNPSLHLGLITAITTLFVIGVFKDFEPAPERNKNAGPPPMIARPTWGIMVLVLFTLSSMLLEGAGIDWSVIYMRDVFASGAIISTLAFTLGALSQGIVRFFADGFVDRYGPVSVAKTMIILLGVGAVFVSLAQNVPMALFGFALIGAGSSSLFPLAMSAAAQRTDRAAAINVAALAQISFITFLVAPPILGLVAEQFGIRFSFAIGLPLVVLSWATISSLVPTNDTAPKGREPKDSI